ncbi:aspartate--tRNA ligase [Granulicella cerasi]|uniref:Aspartate--tRNA(Asp/Asn) ligase n=1 Tax=Granulicella cerasi TaxID=741063 RepID=A0ABW1ZC67_9BACT|nr:aspartate--tRNA ligase [Granulicella cerasi]
MTLDFLGNLQRSHKLGELRASDAGSTVILMGWVNRRRDHGDLIFLDLRDRTGITQVVFDKSDSIEAHLKAETSRPEFVVAVRGKVRERGEGLKNPKMDTGDIEVVAEECWLLNEAKTPPFPIADDAPITNEEVRLKYRYLDLRRPELQKNFVLRHKVARAIREYLSDNDFLEVETPLLTRSTPEGARDYLVPSRVHAGEFYALPQSPQIFKQILMIGGFDRYFQIARCFRDEDLRADRQPDFTQIDLEMTFPQQETIFGVAEGFLRAAFKVAGITLPEGSFLKMSYDEAIQKYGIDKPDMRLPAMVNLSDVLTPELRVTLKIDPTLPVYGFTIPRVGELSGSARKALLAEVRTSFGESGLDLLDVARLRTAEQFAPLAEEIGAKLNAEQVVFNGESLTTDDLIIVVTPKPETPHAWNYDTLWIPKRVGQLRLDLAKKYADKHGLFAQTGTAADFKFLWVTDFPMYEWNEEHKRWDAAHHPFTSPHEEDIKSGALYNDKGAVRALAYDIVLNGTELGSGSIRIHRQDVQAEIFRSLGMSDEEAKERFGFFLDALEYGTPPHGGIALGLDRIVMILAGASSLREVIAFPKTAKAIDLMVDAPSPANEVQLRELNLRIVHKS